MRNGTRKNVFKKIYFLLPIVAIIMLTFPIFSITHNTIPISLNASTISFNPYKSNIDESILATLYTHEELKTYTNSEATSRFLNSHSMVIGDSVAEGLSVYQILDASSVIWTRGRTIQYMTADLDKAIQYSPANLFLAYGANDLLSWCGNVDGYINAYRNSINHIRNVLPNTKIYINCILPVSDKALQNNPDYQYRELFNQRLMEFCKEENITFIDNTEILLNTNNGSPFEPDGVHPRPGYYKDWVSNMINVSGI